MKIFGILITKSRRSYSLMYHLKENTKDRIRVSKTMFLICIGLGEWTVRNFVSHNVGKNEVNKINVERNNLEASDEDQIGRIRQNNRIIVARKLIIIFLESHP